MTEESALVVVLVDTIQINEKIGLNSRLKIAGHISNATQHISRFLIVPDTQQISAYILITPNPF